MSFAELNPTINYNRMEPSSYLDEYGGFDYVPSFNKTQDEFKYKNNQEISLNSKICSTIVCLSWYFNNSNKMGTLKFPLPQHGSNIDKSFFSHNSVGILLIISLIQSIGVGSSLLDL